MSSEDKGDDDDGSTIVISGELGLQSSSIESAALSVAIGTGRTKTGIEVLVPFLACQIKGNFGKNDEELKLDTILAYDNVAFLLMRFASEYEEALEMIDSVSRGPIKPLPVRLNNAAEWLEAASGAAQRAAAGLRRLAEADAPPEAPPPLPPPRKRIRVVRTAA